MAAPLCRSGACYRVTQKESYKYDDHNRVSETTTFIATTAGSGSTRETKIHEPVPAKPPIPGDPERSMTVKEAGGLGSSKTVYDAKKRPIELWSLARNTGGSPHLLATWSYGLNGVTTKTTYEYLPDESDPASDNWTLSKTTASETQVDDWGRVVRVKTPEAGEVSYEYDMKSRLAKRKSADGTLTLYLYDNSNRLTQVMYGVSPVTGQQDAPIKYYYDNQGIDVTECATGQTTSVTWSEQNAEQRLAKVEDHAGVRQYAYDPVGRVVLVTEQRNGESCARVTRTQYDSAGRVAALQYPTGRLIEYVYNGTEPTVPTSIWTHIDGEPLELVSQVRTAGGRVTGWRSWNGVENVAGAYLTGQPKLKRATMAGETEPLSKRLVTSVDAQGNPLHIDDVTAATTENLTYDPAFLTLLTAQSADPSSPAPYRDIQYTVARGLEGNRLKVRQLMPSVSATDMCVAQTVESVRTSTYLYPATSSRLKEIHVEQTDAETGAQWEMSNLFFYTASGAMSSWVVYDDRGTHIDPITSEPETTSVVVRSVEMKYDQEDEMVEWTDDTTTHRYEYDSRHLRSRKLQADGQKTQFWYAGGGQLLAEQHQPASGSEPATIREYVWLGGTVAAFVDSEVTSGGMEDDSVAEAYFVHSGLLSEARAVTDASGFIVWRGDRDPFGTMNSRTASSLAGGYTIGFPGQYSDQETGMVYNWHRYYNPAIGRYVGADPLLAVGMSMQPYEYVGGNPISYVDPWGLDAATAAAYWAWSRFFATAGAGAAATGVGNAGLSEGLEALAGAFALAAMLEDLSPGPVVQPQAPPAPTEMAKPKDKSDSKADSKAKADSGSNNRVCACTCLGRSEEVPDKKCGDRNVGRVAHGAECRAECKFRGFSNSECK